MPAYTPTDEAMDTSYSEPATKTPVEKPETETESETESVDEENAGASEILVSKKELPSGVKEGDTCKFKVTKDFGDEVSLTYVKEAAEQAGQPTKDNMEAETASEISALDTGGEE